jgi:hypothetical protein
VPGLGAGDRALAQLLAAAALEGRLLLERDLELVEALAHAEVAYIGRHGRIEPINGEACAQVFA